MSSKTEIYEDVWIPSICSRCYANCGILVHRVNGVVVKIEGNPDTDMGSHGGLCAKGLAGLQVLYDPNRLNVPLRRTNPEKGLGVDPGWKEITWDEALDEIADRLKKIVEDDPRKLQLQYSASRSCYIHGLYSLLRALWNTSEPETAGYRYNGPNLNAGGGGLYCGQGAHELAGLVYASWSIVPDFKYCNYAIFFGSNKGTGSGHSSQMCMRLHADARVRGMKRVVLDPQCNFNSAKADEWVPIIPGTDLAVILAMCNIIINELGIWDAVFLKTKTNAPYLVGPDQRYVRDKESGNPLVWDVEEEKAVPYNYRSIPDYATACTIDYALEGEYQVDGVSCHPTFQLIREHLRQYTPEMAAAASTVPVETIRRMAVEFAEAAQVGSTITIDGHQLPLRPVSAIIFRGGEAHENSFHTCFAVCLLNLIVGSADVPGGTLGWPATSLGYPGTGKFNLPLLAGEDGMLEVNHFGPLGAGLKRKGPWPAHMPEKKNHLTMTDIFPMAMHSFVPIGEDREEMAQKNEAPYRLEAIVAWASNSIMSMANQEKLAEAYKEIPFMVVSELWSTEMAEGFADILLPDTCYLEQESWTDGLGFNFNHPFGMEDWSFHVLQPVVPPQGQRRSFYEVMWEVAKRMGQKEKLVEVINTIYAMDDEYKLKPEEELTPELMCDKMLQNYFGPEHDWEWFKKHGFISWPKKVEEAYWRYFVDTRVPVYMEHLVDTGEKMREITGEIGLDIDLNQYTPLCTWFPCSIHGVDSPEYDMYCYSYRDTLHTGSHTMEQPWLDEASNMNPYTYNITMNGETAARKGLKDGDLIELEAVAGYKVQGTLKTMEGQHPLTIGIAACSGHWGKGMPIALGKGTNFNTLMTFDMKHIDPLVLTTEMCARVKVSVVKRS
ncbi:MAG: molybdopterin-dependent oxidoreductase [Chloroflexi bacterium]|nr:molybdopterin-dependent oxidoreductase [Chloroflexota bacterium]